MVFRPEQKKNPNSTKLFAHPLTWPYASVLCHLWSWRQLVAPSCARFERSSLSTFGPARVLSQRVNLCCVPLIWMVMQREYTGVYPGSNEKRPYVQWGEKYCISLHLSACVGVTSCERGSRSQVSERERVQRRLLEMLIFYGGVMTCFSLSPPLS
jgi:hypothetical protein